MMFWKREKPVPTGKEPTPGELVLNTVRTGKVIRYKGDSGGISMLEMRGGGLDVRVEIYSSGSIRDLKVGKTLHDGGMASATQSMTFGTTDIRIAKAAYRRIRGAADEEVRAATEAFFEDFANG